MRAVLGLVVAVGLSANPALANWEIRNEKDPITDEIAFSALTSGDRSSLYYYHCNEKGRKAYVATGFIVPGATISGRTIVMRYRQNGGEIKQITLHHNDGMIGLGGDAAGDFFNMFRDSTTFAFDVVDDNGKRFVDSFTIPTSIENNISLLQGMIECLKRGQ